MSILLQSWYIDSISIDNGITAPGFVLCDAEDFDDVSIGLTRFGKKRILDAFKEAKALH